MAQCMRANELNLPYTVSQPIDFNLAKCTQTSLFLLLCAQMSFSLIRMACVAHVYIFTRIVSIGFRISTQARTSKKLNFETQLRMRA